MISKWIIYHCCFVSELLSKTHGHMDSSVKNREIKKKSFTILITELITHLQMLCMLCAVRTWWNACLMCPNIECDSYVCAVCRMQIENKMYFWLLPYMVYESALHIWHFDRVEKFGLNIHNVLGFDDNMWWVEHIKSINSNSYLHSTTRYNSINKLRFNYVYANWRQPKTKTVAPTKNVDTHTHTHKIQFGHAVIVLVRRQ